MDARQTPVHRAALTYGQAFATVLRDPADPARPVIRGVSPRLMHASYEDPAADALPLWALQVETVSDAEGVEARAGLYDATHVYDLLVGGKGGPQLLASRPHGMGGFPVVRFAPDIDLRGCPGQGRDHAQRSGPRYVVAHPRRHGPGRGGVGADPGGR